jgi:acyl-CoA synthetase (NDP forming)
MAHRLEPLLNPASIAVIGASAREYTPGREIMNNLLNGRFGGPLYAVNPGYEEICGVPCFPNLASLPEAVEQVFIAVGDAQVEGAFKQALEHGARSAAVICSLTDDGEHPPLMARIRDKALNAGLLLIGGNTMGYYNFERHIWACAFDTRDNHVDTGGITLITHSGSGLSGLIDCDERLDCNLAISTGQELVVRMDQYMDYALERESTRVIGLFMETARDPMALRNALRRASERGIPVVVLKVGRTELSARLAESHSGALAGRDDAYQALFDRYGVIRVSDMDEFTTTLIMFNQPHPVAPGGLVALHDSGGERQLLVDLADELQVPMATLGQETVRRLENTLDPGLPAINPLDAWSAGGPGYHRIMEDCLAAMMADPDAAMGAVVHDRAPDGRLYTDYFEYMRKGHAASGKPAFLVANRQGTGSDPAVVSVTREGFPVLDGLRSFLVGARAMMRYRRFLARPSPAPPLVDENLAARWRERLASMQAKDQEPRERTALELLNDFQVPACPVIAAESESEAIAAATELGYPLVLKTAEPGIVHKSDIGGVAMCIASRDDLVAAYSDLAARIGRKVIVMPQVTEAGAEMVLGMFRDEQFGPIVMLGFGGRDIELEGQVRFLVPPFDSQAALRAVNSLPGRARLDAHRGRGALAIDAYCNAAARFSVMVSSLAETVFEIDVNPVIVHERGCVAVDAFVGLGGVEQADSASPGERKDELSSNFG